MGLFLIYRHGANTANQSCCDKRAVSIVEAPDPESACATHRIDAGLPSYLTLDDSVKIFANQRVSAVAWAGADADDWSAVAESCESREAQRE